MKRRVHLSLGSNVGDRAAHLRRALASIAAWPEVEAMRVSAVYRTAHVGPGLDETPDYFNLCVALDGAPAPREILRRGGALERDAGRAPDSHLRPRPLDVDLLLVDALRVDDDDLVLPHPRIAARRFVLQPLADLDPTLTVTRTGETVASLLAQPAVAAQHVERLDLDLTPSAREAEAWARTER